LGKRRWDTKIIQEREPLLRQNPFLSSTKRTAKERMLGERMMEKEICSVKTGERLRPKLNRKPGGAKDTPKEEGRGGLGGSWGSKKGGFRTALRLEFGNTWGMDGGKKLLGLLKKICLTFRFGGREGETGRPHPKVFTRRGGESRKEVRA